MSIMGYGWRKFLSPLYRLIGGNSKVSLGKGLIIYGFPTLNVCAGAKIEIGSGVVLCSKSDYTALGVNKPIIFRAIASGAVISVGPNSGFSGTVIVAAQEVRVGADCLIGADVLICDNDFHPINPEGRRLAKSGIKSSPIVIGDNVFVGTRSTILKGSRIGANSVIGAGSVVVGEIPANVVAAGNPAKIICSLQTAGVAKEASEGVSLRENEE